MKTALDFLGGTHHILYVGASNTSHIVQAKERKWLSRIASLVMVAQLSDPFRKPKLKARHNLPRFCFVWCRFFASVVSDEMLPNACFG